jgi:hypothetical protein
VKILLGLRELPPERVDHDFFFLHHSQERCFLAKSSLNLLGFSLTFQLDFAKIIFKAFLLEFEFIILSLEHSSMVSLFFYILSIFDEKLILVNFELVSFFSEIKALLLGLTKSPLKIINISPQLSLLLSILA